LRGDLIERAAEAGLRSIFVGFETLTQENLPPKQQAPGIWAAITKQLPTACIRSAS